MSAQTVHRLGAPRNPTSAAPGQKKRGAYAKCRAQTLVTRHPKYAEMSARAAKVYGVLFGLGDGVVTDDRGRQVIRTRMRIPDWVSDDGEYKLGLASRCGYKRRTVEKALAELKEIGWLEVKRTGRGSKFTIIVPIERGADDAHDEASSADIDDASDAHVQDTPPARPNASDAHVQGVSTIQTTQRKPKNQTTNTTPQPHDDDDGCGGGGGVDALVQLEIRNPTRDELARNPRLTPEVIEIIARKIRRSGGKVGATVQALRDPVEIDAAERELKEERERVEQAEARRVAEETERAERERAEVIEQDRRTVRDILAKPDGPEYIERVRGKINKAEGDRFANTDMMSDTADAAELRRIIAGRASGALIQKLSTEATDDELWRATQGTPASIVRRDIKAGRLSYHDLSAIWQHIDQQRTATAAS